MLLRLKTVTYSQNYTLFPDYQALAKKLLEKLEGKVPGLLKNEPYFKDVFY